MSIFPSKYKKFGALALISYFLWGFLILILIFFSWIFLFVYQNLYTVLIQEAAIVSLKSDLLVAKVNRTKFDAIVNDFEQKKTPFISINFETIKNPFKTKPAETPK